MIKRLTTLTAFPEVGHRTELARCAQDLAFLTRQSRSQAHRPHTLHQNQPPSSSSAGDCCLETSILERQKPLLPSPTLELLVLGQSLHRRTLVSFVAQQRSAVTLVRAQACTECGLDQDVLRIFAVPQKLGINVGDLSGLVVVLEVWRRQRAMCVAVVASYSFPTHKVLIRGRIDVGTTVSAPDLDVFVSVLDDRRIDAAEDSALRDFVLEDWVCWERMLVPFSAEDNLGCWAGVGWIAFGAIVVPGVVAL